MFADQNIIIKEEGMNTTETTQKMKELKLYGMYRMLEELRSTRTADSLSHEEFIGHLVDAEWDNQYNKKISRLIKSAGV